MQWFVRFLLGGAVLSSFVLGFAQDAGPELVDPCTLLAPAEVQTLLGGAVGEGEGTELAAFRQCEWNGVDDATGALVGTLQLRVQNGDGYATPEALAEFVTFEGASVGVPLPDLPHPAAYATEAADGGPPGPVVLFALYAHDLLVWAEVHGSAEGIAPGDAAFERFRELMTVAAGRTAR